MDLLTAGMELFETGCRNFTPNPIINRSSRRNHNVLNNLTSILNDMKHMEELDEGFSDDIINDAFHLTNEIQNKDDYYYYPHGQALSSSLINLSKESRSNDEWFRILSESSSGTKNYIKNYKLIFISTEGSTRIIEYSNEIEYWITVTAIKRLFLNQNINCTGKCRIPSSNSNEISSGNNLTTSFLQLLGQNKDDCIYEIKTPFIKVYQKNNNQEIFSLHIDSLRAVKLFADYEIIREYLLEITLNPNSDIISNSDVSINILDNENKPYNNNNNSYETICIISKTTKNDTMFIPINKSDFVSSSLSSLSLYESNNNNNNNNSPPKIALMNINKLTGYEKSYLTDINIPYTSFYDQNKLTNKNSFNSISKCDLIINTMITKTIEISLPENPKILAYRIIIKKAIDLKYSNNKNKLPNAYCTVYLVSNDGEKISTNTYESRTGIVCSITPVWNREFILKINEGR
jgi:hypothetical protein